MADTLTFSLVPMEQDVTFDALLKGIESVRTFVLAVDYAVTRGAPQPWIVDSLRSSAPTVVIRRSDRSTAAIDAIVNGVTEITSQPDLLDPPPHFSEEALKDLKNMQRLFRVGIRRIEIGTNGSTPQLQPARISSDIARRVDRIIGKGYSALGSVEGELGAIKTYGQTPYLTVWDSLSHQPIRCSFPANLIEEVKALLQKRVRVTGRVNYFLNGRPRNITEFQAIGDLTPDLRLPVASFGCIPDLTKGVDSVEYVSSMRR